jgi:hypothetical protein
MTHLRPRWMDFLSILMGKTEGSEICINLRLHFFCGVVFRFGLSGLVG